MISIRQNLRLYDGNNAMLGQGKQTLSGQRKHEAWRDFATFIWGSNLLADAAVARKNVGILRDGQLGRVGVADFEHAAPLCKAGSVLLVLGAAFR